MYLDRRSYYIRNLTNSILTANKNTKENVAKKLKFFIKENPAKKPFEIIFCDVEKISQIIDFKGDSYLANVYYSNAKQNVIYIDNKYRNYPKEVLAALFAGESINIDGKNSIIEQLVTMGVSANVWKELVLNNSKINNDSIAVIKSLNAINRVMGTTNGALKAGDYNNLWAFSGLFKGNNKTSKGFRNENLNVYF